MNRVGMITGLRVDKVTRYLELHKAVWPEILSRISKSNIRNYSIYLRQLDDGQHLLFSYFEYVGENFEADMQAMAEDPRTQEWWALTAPCQKPVADAELGGAWVAMQEIFHLD